MSPTLGGPRPDLLVVVMDCVRARDFRVGAEPLVGMPFCSTLAEESIVFPRAVAPAGWTIPSHASLFTGRYPWVHGLHARGLPRLDATEPVVARELASSGYRTLSLSANPFVSDRAGLTDGFEASAWGGWWERHFRAGSSPYPPSGRGLPTRPGRGQRALRTGRLWPTTLRVGREVLRFPWIVDLAATAVRAIRGADESCPTCVSTWIEPTLRRWLGTVRAEDPVFVFVNLMEAHEPYPPSSVEGDRRLRSEARRVRQDFTHWLEGQYTPSARDSQALDGLYRSAVRALDHRLRSIVDAFRSAGRWGRTAMVLTSDHGQSTGTNGWLSHGMNLEDDLLRVPLWLRLPGERRAARIAPGWASLVDVRPTLLELASAAASGPSDGLPLARLADGPRDGPVWSMADGVIWESARSRMSPEQRARYDRLLFARFDDSGKTVFEDPMEFARLWAASAPRGSTADARPTGPTDGGEGVPAERERRRRVWQPSRLGGGDSVTRRLESWGYA